MRRRGRPRVDRSRLRSELSPEQRGYVSVRMRADAVDLLDAWVSEHHLPSRHAAVHDLIARASAAPPPPLSLRPLPYVAWERIREELLAEFGSSVSPHRIDAALGRAGRPRE